MFGFTLERIRTLATASHLVLVPLGHCSLATRRRLDLATLGPSSIHPGPSKLCSWFVDAITLKQPLGSFPSTSQTGSQQTVNQLQYEQADAS